MKKFTFISMAFIFIMTMSFQSFSQTIEFEDNFEGGAGNWVLTGDWGLTDAYSFSPTHCMTDSPGGDYSASQDTYCTMGTGVDLSDPSILSASAVFYSIYDIENSIDFDWVKVQASDDDFATFSDLGIFNGEGNLDPWMEYSYSLGAYIGSADVKVRFHFHSDGGYEVDGFYFDDFMITSSDEDNASPFIGYDNPPTFYEGSLGDYVFTTELIDVSGIASATVNYQVEGGAWESADGVNTSGDEYEFTIPAQPAGSMVIFNLEVIDASPNSNVAETDDYKYISGEYLFYDDPEVAFYTNLMAGDGCAVVFTLDDPTTIVTGLIRNYQDQSLPPNKDFIFHVWDGDNYTVGDDLITPFVVSPAATPADPNPMTVVDLREYNEELSVPASDVFIGITVPEDTVRITMAEPVANRSFTLDDSGEWVAAAYDFHFRMVTAGSTVGIEDNETKVLESAIMFPNPATDVLYIDSKNEILNLQVVNTAGQTVYNENVKLMKTKLQISHFQPGIYFVNVETINGVSTKKIIVK